MIRRAFVAEMKDWPTTYFRFQGRFNRARYWLHSVMALGVAIVLTLIAMYMFPIPDPLIEVFQSQTLLKVIQGMITAAPAVTFLFISTVISVKRLHDRDKSGWWAVLYLAVPAVLFLLVVFSAGEGASTWPAVFAIPFAVLVLITFVELACLKGTDGPNQYGPDRLPTTTDATKTQKAAAS